MPTKKKNVGGRPALGPKKREQRSTTYHPDHIELIDQDRRMSGLRSDGRTYNTTTSDIVEKALNLFYRDRLMKMRVSR